MKKQIFKTALISILGLGLFAANSSAIELGIDGVFDGATPWNTQADNVAGDNSPIEGKISVTDWGWNAPWVGEWLVDATGINLFTTGFSAGEELDLNTIALSSQSEGDVYIMLSEVDLTAPGWDISVGGTTDGTVEFFMLYNTGNGYWGNLPALPGTYGGVNGNFTDNFDFSESLSLDVAGADLYSVVLGAHIIHDGAGQTSFDLAGSAVPEPTTMLLFGTGIAGLAAVGRRRRK